MGRRSIDEADRRRTQGLVAELIAARDRIGLSIDALSKTSGVHYETVRAVLGGRSAAPNFFIVADLARALKVRLEALDRKSQP
ncbi:MAG TPA: helix-turn-helix transcriptional regulator [Candidatus Saccharimonadales bacterium]|nr:helix-turn-helix transcriptional regulator [Candidatus Saccharimonadales bacterium]